MGTPEILYYYYFITMIAFHFHGLPMISLFTDLVFSPNCPKQMKLVHINKAVLMWSVALLIVWYCTDAFSNGMPSLMDVPAGWDKCCIILKEPISFFGISPRGDVTKSWNGGLTNRTVTVQDQSIHSINMCYNKGQYWYTKKSVFLLPFNQFSQ